MGCSYIRNPAFIDSINRNRINYSSQYIIDFQIMIKPSSTTVRSLFILEGAIEATLECLGMRYSLVQYLRHMIAFVNLYLL